MKKSCIIVFLLGLIFFNFLNSKEYQKINKLNFYQTKFSLGYYITTNLFNFDVNPNIINSVSNKYQFVPIIVPEFGVSIGLINNFKLNKFIDFRIEPTIHVSKKKINFRYVRDYMQMKYINNTTNLNVIFHDITCQINSIYFDLPFLIKINGDWNVNHRPYFISGLSCIFNLTPYNNFITNDGISALFKFKKINFSFQSEIGMEFLFKDIKITPSFKGIIFLNNELVDKKLNSENSNYLFNLSNNLQSISSYAWMISIKFE